MSLIIISINHRSLKFQFPFINNEVIIQFQIWNNDKQLQFVMLFYGFWSYDLISKAIYLLRKYLQILYVTFKIIFSKSATGGIIIKSFHELITNYFCVEICELNLILWLFATFHLTYHMKSYYKNVLREIKF